jgi:long-chain acyl-CoA synthetase
MFGYVHEKLYRFADLLAAVEKPDLAWLENKVAGLSSADPAFIVYTSGTTGHPKGALVSHGKHLAATDTVIAHYPTLREKAHRTAVYLPMCHVLGRDVAITLPLMSQLVPHFGEDPEDFAATLFEVAPTVMFTVPRYLQSSPACAGRRAQFQPHQARRLRIGGAVSRANMCAGAGTAPRPA